MFILPQFEYIHWKVEALKRLSNGLTYTKMSAQTFVGACQGRKCVLILKWGMAGLPGFAIHGSSLHLGAGI